MNIHNPISEVESAIASASALFADDNSQPGSELDSPVVWAIIKGSREILHTNLTYPAAAELMRAQVESSGLCIVAERAAFKLNRPAPVPE